METIVVFIEKIFPQGKTLRQHKYRVNASIIYFMLILK